MATILFVSYVLICCWQQLRGKSDNSCLQHAGVAIAKPLESGLLYFDQCASNITVRMPKAHLVALSREVQADASAFLDLGLLPDTDEQLEIMGSGTDQMQIMAL